MIISHHDQTAIEDCIRDKIKHVEVQHGGCISKSFKITCKAGKRFFAKTSLAGMDLRKEANGLREIAKSSILTPGIVAANKEILILEWVENQQPSQKFFTKFATQLANLHKITSSNFGFYEDNYIGSLTQHNPLVNDKNEAWPEYFFQQRLKAQVDQAEARGYSEPQLLRLLAQLEKQMGEIIGDCLEPPSLIHGDLWSGNYISGPEGVAYLIDPAVYFGHREIDLAMSKLFGGFPESFYHAYEREYPLKPGFEKRCLLYQLYYLLVHLNLFGRSYYGQCLDVFNQLL